MKQIDLREGARRQHRAVALLALIQCWRRGLDGVAFERSHLQRLLGLKRFRTTRERWLVEDMEEFFPHHEMYWRSGPGGFHSLLVCRVPFADWLPRKTMSMSTTERLAAMGSGAPRIKRFGMWPADTGKRLGDPLELLPKGLEPFFAAPGNSDEKLLSAYLTLLATGQISPDAIPGVKELPQRPGIRLVQRKAS